MKLLPLILGLALLAPADEGARYVEYGNDLQAQGRTKESEPYYRYAVEVDPSLWQAWVGLGNVAYHQKNWKGALEAYQKAKQLNPEYKEVDSLIVELKARQTPFYLGDDFKLAMKSLP